MRSMAFIFFPLDLSLYMAPEKKQYSFFPVAVEIVISTFSIHEMRIYLSGLLFRIVCQTGAKAILFVFTC